MNDLIFHKLSTFDSNHRANAKLYFAPASKTQFSSSTDKDATSNTTTTVITKLGISKKIFC